MKKFNFNLGDTVVVYKIHELGYPLPEQKGIMIDNTVEEISEMTHETAYDNILIMDGTKMNRANPTYLTGGLYRIKSCKIVLVEKSVLSRYEEIGKESIKILSMSDEELINYLDERGLNGGV
jgi:hypothetical protein